MYIARKRNRKMRDVVYSIVGRRGGSGFISQYYMTACLNLHERPATNDETLYIQLYTETVSCMRIELFMKTRDTMLF